MSDIESRSKEASWDGRHDFRSGKPETDNHYTPGTIEFNAYVEAWRGQRAISFELLNAAARWADRMAMSFGPACSPKTAEPPRGVSSVPASPAIARGEAE